MPSGGGLHAGSSVLGAAQVPAGGLGLAGRRPCALSGGASTGMQLKSSDARCGPAARAQAVTGAHEMLLAGQELSPFRGKPKTASPASFRNVSMPPFASCYLCSFPL